MISRRNQDSQWRYQQQIKKTNKEIEEERDGVEQHTDRESSGGIRRFVPIRCLQSGETQPRACSPSPLLFSFSAVTSISALYLRLLLLPFLPRRFRFSFRLASFLFFVVEILVNLDSWWWVRFEISWIEDIDLFSCFRFAWIWSDMLRLVELEELVNSKSRNGSIIHWAVLFVLHFLSYQSLSEVTFNLIYLNKEGLN